MAKNIKPNQPGKGKKKVLAGKDITAVKKEKPVKKIMTYYYFNTEAVTAKELTTVIHSVNEETVDVWPELNLMEVVMDFDSLIFQDATECFIDSEDLKYFEAQHIQTKFEISYDTGDIAKVRAVMKDIMTEKGGIICSDTDEFEPSFTVEQLGSLI